MTMRRGFTLVELLVVIAIIGLLIGMLLPALNSVRESARLAQCQSQLKQVGLAVQVYHEARNAYPSGRDRMDQYGVSWAFRLLPYLEQQHLYLAFDSSERVDSDANATAMRTSVAIFNCPARTESSANRNFDNNNDPPLVMSAAAGGDFAANAGTFYRYDETDQIDFDRAGPIYTRSGIRSKQVTDGSSHTFAVGHRHIPPLLVDVVTPMQGYYRGDTAFFAGDSPWTIFADTRRGLAAGIRDTNRTKFGSPHRHATPFVFLDGHVDVIDNETPRRILQMFCAIGDGGNPYNPPEIDDNEGT